MTDSRKEARAALRRRLKEASAELMAAESAEISRKLLSLGSLREARTILLYHSLPSEPSTASLISALIAEGRTVALPVVKEDFSLELREYDSSRLRPAAMGLTEPDGTCRTIPPEEIDFAVIPGLGFDLEGHRLGRGKGCYDRLLPLLRPDCPKYGLAFSMQIMQKIPVEPHDAVLDGIITIQDSFYCSDSAPTALL
ncbi:MAG: 5-formyltetrahydrofolate cyclo-ligase [Bacteroidales bacterium]|nr:5-formyltetrahydrofolate cyclo-ligase [Bacteroidales bacterium]